MRRSVDVRAGSCWLMLASAAPVAAEPTDGLPDVARAIAAEPELVSGTKQGDPRSPSSQASNRTANNTEAGAADSADDCD